MAQRRMLTAQGIRVRAKNVEELLDQKPVYGYIYFLLLDGEVVYVGKSIDYPTRLKGHRNKRYPLHYKEYTHCTLLKVPVDQMAELEKEYIKSFKPVYNRQGV